MTENELGTWDLTDLRIADIQSAEAKIAHLVSSFEARRVELNDDIETGTFLELLQEFEAIVEHAERLHHATQLKLCENTTDPQAAANHARVERFIAEVKSRILFFTLGFKNLCDAKIDELIQASAGYRYFLETQLREKPFTLSEPEEGVIEKKNVTGRRALLKLYDTMTSRMRHEWPSQNGDEDGVEELNTSQLMIHVYDATPESRERAYQLLLKNYAERRDELGEIFRALVSDWGTEALELRGHSSAIAVRNVDNDLPDASVETLLQVCCEQQTLFHRFFELKRKALGLKRMRRYDIYAPLTESAQKTEYSDALPMILQALKGFSGDFADAAENIITANHIHWGHAENKIGGAFCADAGTSIEPYVLVNFHGTMRDVSTLAHELGHGAHFVLAAGNTELTRQASLPLCETASIFAEMVLSEQLLQAAPERAQELVFNKLGELYASIIRQVGFVSFEIQAHEMITNGATLDELSDAYIEALRAQFGPGMEIADDFRHEWLYIPHIFHHPFYCYSYAFGNLLTLGLYEVYLEQGEPFVPKFIDLLRKGGSESPIQMTKAVGVDICSADFWRQSFEPIRRMVEQLEAA